MSGSLTDVLTTQKNGVTAINNLARQGFVPTMLGRGSIGTSYSTFYTCPNSSWSIVTCIDVSNTTAGALDVDIHIVPANGTAGASNPIVWNESVAANSHYQWTGFQVMNAGDTLQFRGSGAGLAVAASGGVSV